MLDPASVAKDDLLPFRIVNRAHFGGNYRLALTKGRARHRFFYYPGMTRDEVLLFVVSDSRRPAGRLAGAPAATVVHAAFADPAGAGEPDRESVDVRVLLSWDA